MKILGSLGPCLNLWLPRFIRFIRFIPFVSVVSDHSSFVCSSVIVHIVCVRVLLGPDVHPDTPIETCLQTYAIAFR